MSTDRMSDGFNSNSDSGSGGVVGEGRSSLTDTGPTAGPDNGLPAASSASSFVAFPTQSPSSSAGASSSDSPGSSPSIIQFSDATNFPPPDEQIWSAAEGVKLFEWTRINQSVEITDITWYARSNWASSFNQGSPVIEAIDFDKNGPSSDTAIENVTDSSAQLVLSNPRVSPYQWWIMAIRLDWTTDFANGFSESGVFTVGDSLNATARHNFLSNLAAFPADKSSFDRITAWKTNLRTNTTGFAPGSPGDAHRGGRHLSTGAKIGIGVACALIGLGLVAALVFLCVVAQRRKKSKGAGALPVAADARAGKPSVVESPLQPPDYSAQRHVGMPLCREDTDSSIALNRRSKNDSLLDSMPGGVSRHLVEEGMTREEILRLEEEERHLDAEIERTARRQ